MISLEGEWGQREMRLEAGVRFGMTYKIASGGGSLFGCLLGILWLNPSTSAPDESEGSRFKGTITP